MGPIRAYYHLYHHSSLVLFVVILVVREEGKGKILMTWYLVLGVLSWHAPLHTGNGLALVVGLSNYSPSTFLQRKKVSYLLFHVEKKESLVVYT